MSWDVGLTDDGDLPPSPRHISGTDLVIQKLRLRLERHRGESVVDITEGIDWKGLLSTKPFPLLDLDAALRDQITAVAGISTIDRLEISQETGSETVRAEADVVTTAEQVIALTIILGDNLIRVTGYNSGYRATRLAKARR